MFSLHRSKTSALAPTAAAQGLQFEGGSYYWEREALREKFDKIRRHCQDALGDAILMGCDENQVRSALRDLIAGLENPHGDERGRSIRAVLSL